MRVSGFMQALLSLTVRAVPGVASLAQQTSAAQALIVDRVDDTRLLQIHGNTHPQARAEYDKGALDPAFLVKRMVPAAAAGYTASIKITDNASSPQSITLGGTGK
jgi:hypothetical protein